MKKLTDEELKTLAKKAKLRFKLVKGRLSRGWTLERALSTPEDMPGLTKRKRPSNNFTKSHTTVIQGGIFDDNL